MVCKRPPAAFGGSPPCEGETRAKRARGSLTHHLELKLSNTPCQPGESCSERVHIICRNSGAHASTTENPGLAPGAIFLPAAPRLSLDAHCAISSTAVPREEGNTVSPNSVPVSLVLRDIRGSNVRSSRHSFRASAPDR